MTSSHMKRWIHVLALLALLAAASPATVMAQDRPSQRQLRTYIPPDQLVSFLPSTPFPQFVEFLNPIFERVTGKQVVDPLSIGDPIGVPVAGYHFIDAFELVLEYNGLTYRETDRYFIIEEIPDEPELVQSAAEARADAGRAGASGEEAMPTLATREIKINAILFELNHTKARDLGLDWNVFFGGQQGQGGSGGSGGGGGSGGAGGADGEQRVTFNLKTKDLFEGVEDLIDAPDVIPFSQLTQFFRLLENEGIGETVAHPSVTVQSGQEGRIQIGSDIPIQTRDFSGNTITQFFSTGIIIDVTPTVIVEALADTAGAPEFEFIHLNVQVEKSGSRPSLSGPIIDRNQVATQVMLLDDEQTIIGGLFSTDETRARRGIPVLKDLPGWFFGLRYVFGYTQRSTSQKELLIVLQAQMLDPLQARARQPGSEDLLEQFRRGAEENIRRASPGMLEKATVPGARSRQPR